MTGVDRYLAKLEAIDKVLEDQRCDDQASMWLTL